MHQAASSLLAFGALRGKVYAPLLFILPKVNTHNFKCYVTRNTILIPPLMEPVYLEAYMLPQPARGYY